MLSRLTLTWSMTSRNCLRVLQSRGARLFHGRLTCRLRLTPPCQTNVASTESEAEREGDDEDCCPKELKLIYNPLEWKIMPVPEIGKKVYMVVPTTKGLIVVVDEFKGTEMEWLLLAQGRLFIYKSEAERYKQKCEAVIGAIVAQLND